jgi:hypothetical protein
MVGGLACEVGTLKSTLFDVGSWIPLIGCSFTSPAFIARAQLGLFLACFYIFHGVGPTLLYQ